MDDIFNGVSADFHGDIYRNIISLRETQALFDDLSNSKEAQQAAIEIEMAAKAHTYISEQPIIDRPFEEAEFNAAINYPFKNWSHTRYSDGSFGVWYGADSLDTSIYETVHHWRRLLLDADWHNRDDVINERKIYLVRCDSVLLDLRLKLGKYPALIDPESYHFTQQIGSRLHHEGHPGIISRSARCNGDIFAIFQARILTNPRHQCYLTYRTDSGSIIIERTPGEKYLQI